MNDTARVAFFDIDGTLTSGGDVWRALVTSPEVSPLRKSWLYATGMPHYLVSKTGLVSQAAFRDRWVRLMAWLMTGWTPEQVQAIAGQIVEEALIPVLRPDVVAVLKQQKTQGTPVALVSTMFERIVAGLADYLDSGAGLGSVVEMRDGHCTGHIIGPTCSGARKLDFAQRYLSQHYAGVTLADCSAYADSASDIPFLAGVGHPVAVYPDATMRAAALEQGWQLFEA